MTIQSTTTYLDTSATSETFYAYRVVAGGLASNEQTVTLPGEDQVTKIVYTSTSTKATYVWFDGMPSDPPPYRCLDPGGDPYLVVGSNSPEDPPTAEVDRIVVQFDTSSIPANAILVDASVELWYPGSGRPPLELDALRVNTSWAEGTNPKNQDTPCSVSGAIWPGPSALAPDDDSYISLPLANTGPAWDSLDVTEPFFDWLVYGHTNFGVLLKLHDETAVGSAVYASDEWSDPSRRPQLHVTYYEPADLPALVGSAVSGTQNQVSNFGGKELFTGRTVRTFYGTRSTIRAPLSDFSIPETTIALFRVDVEPLTDNGIGLLQTGFAMTRGITFANCGPRSRLTHFLEFKPNEDTPYACTWFDRPGDPLVVYGGSRRYEVARIPGNCQGGAGTVSWRIRISDIELGCLDWVNRVRAGKILAGGEIGHPSERKRGSMSACYGCGGTLWQRAYNVSAGGASWKTIRRAHNQCFIRPDLCSGWIVDPLPGPWHIRNEP